MRYYEILEARPRMPDRPRRRLWMRLGEVVAIGDSSLALMRNRMDDGTHEFEFLARCGDQKRSARFGPLSYADRYDLVLVPRVVGCDASGVPSCVLVEVIAVGAAPAWPQVILREVAA